MSSPLNLDPSLSFRRLAQIEIVVRISEFFSYAQVPSLVNRVQSDLFLNGTQGINHEMDVLIEFDAQFLDALPDVIAINRSRKSFVL